MSYNYNNVLTRSSITLQLIEDVAIYKAELYSSSGNIFRQSDSETELTVKVYKGFSDITSRFTDIVWRRFSFNEEDIVEDLAWGTAFNGLKTITVTKADVNEKVKIQCEVYDVIYGERTLVATESITIIDVNDLKPSTSAPSNPIDGQIWLDSSIDPAILKMWDGSRNAWLPIGQSDANTRNFFRNSNFFKRTFEHWDFDGNLQIKEILVLAGTTFARLKHSIATGNYNGISQTINDVKKKSKYTIQAKSKLYGEDLSLNGGLCVSILSGIDIKDANGNILETRYTLVKEENFQLTDVLQELFFTITTLEDTEKLKVIYSGAKDGGFDILISETKLENNTRKSSWDLAPEDIAEAVSDITPVIEDMVNDNKLTPVEKAALLGTWSSIKNEINTILSKADKFRNYAEHQNIIDKSYEILEVYETLYNALNLILAPENLSITDSVDGPKIKADIELYNLLKNEFEQLVQANIATKNDISYKVEILSTNGGVFKNGVINTTLYAKVYCGKDDVTSIFGSGQFRWTKTNIDGTLDTAWNIAHQSGFKSVVITGEDVRGKATFNCDVYDIEGNII
jgi:hypothetical protein